MDRVHIDFNKFIWLLEAGSFSKFVSGIVMEIDKTELSMQARVSAIFNYDLTVSVTTESEGPFRLVFMNGVQNEALEQLIGDLKLIKAEILTVTQDEHKIYFQTDVGEFSTIRTNPKSVVYEYDSFVNLDLKEVNELQAKSIHLKNITLSCLKRAIEAFKKMMKLSDVNFGLKVDTDWKAKYVMTDSSKTKKFAINVEYDKDPDVKELEEPVAFLFPRGILAIHTFLKKFQTFDIYCNDNKIFICTRDREEGLYFEVLILT